MSETAAPPPDRGRPPGGLALLDERGVVRFWSDRMAELTGIAADAARGRPIGTIYPPDGADDGTVDEHLARSARLGALVTVGRRRARDGWVRCRTLVTPQRDRDERIRGFAYFVTPFSEPPPVAPAGHGARRRALLASAAELARRAEALRAARAEAAGALATYRRAFDLSPDALLVTDPDGVIVDVNVTAARMLGLPDERPAHKPLAVFVPLRHRLAFRRLLLRIRQEARVEHAPLVLASREGAEVRVRATAVLGDAAAREGAGASIVHWSLRPAGDDDGQADTLEDARRRLVQVAEAERVRISREIHDVLGQSLTALSLEVKALEGRVRGRDAEERLRRVRQLVTSVSEQAHGIAQALRPAGLPELGLERAIRALAEDWGERARVEVDFHALGLDRRLAAEVETTVLRVAQELLTNVARHARASRVSVVLERTPWQVVMVVDDDGHGFDPERAGRGVEGRLGLVGLRERVALVGGSITHESAPGRGTSAFLRIPLPGDGGALAAPPSGRG